MNPPSANEMSFAARRRHRHGRCGQLVLAHADDHAADAGAFEVPDQHQHGHEHEEAEVVVRTVSMGELEEPDIGARDLDGGAAGGEELSVEEVRLRGDGEREGADGEQQSADAQRAHAHHDRDETGQAGTEQHRPEERDPADPTVEDARALPSDVELEPADERGGGESAEPGEGHLPERQLPAPAGEHHHGDRAEGEGDDRGPGLVALRLVAEQREDHRGDHRHERDELRHPFDPPDAPQPFGHGGDAWRELEALPARPAVIAARRGRPAPARSRRARTARARSRPCS